MTNRDRINRMSNKEFVEKFNTRGQNCEVCAYRDKENNYCNSKEFINNVNACEEGFIKWLSQETKKEAIHSSACEFIDCENRIGSCIECDTCNKVQKLKEYSSSKDNTLITTPFESPKTKQLTEEEYKGLLERIEKLEEFAKIKIDDFWNNIYKEAHKEEFGKTADEMFEELGYEKVKGEIPIG